MNTNKKESVQQEIRRRVFERFDLLQEKKVNLQNCKHTLDALQEVTGLPRVELETIAEEVRTSFEDYEDKFFSVRNQAAMVLGPFAILIILAWLTTIWVF